MEFLLVLAAIVYAIVKYAAKNPASGAKEFAEKASGAVAAAKKPAGAKKAAPIGKTGAQKRAQTAQTERWRAAKRQQDDAEQLHAIHVDSCESRLESLRVLYEAGILDKEEYADRVLRTKLRHARGGDA